MKKMRRVITAAVLVSSLLVTPVFAEPTVDDLKADKEAAQDEAASIQAELTELLDKLGRLEEDLIAKGEEITKAQDDLKASEEKEEQQYEAMKLRIKYMYENGDTDAIEALVSAENFSDLVNKAEYVQSVHSYDRKKLQEYIDTKNEIAELKATLETEQENMQAMQSEYEEEEQQLSAMLEEKREEIANFDVQIQAAAEAAAREAAERAAAEAAASNQSGSGDNGNITTASNDSQNNSTENNQNTAGNNQNTSGENTQPSGGSPNTGGNTSVAQAIVNAAYSQLGVPYVWGGTTPYGGLDCSGLVQYCHSVAGISLPRVSQAQGGCGIAVSNPQPGDIVCYGSHVGIYIGGGQMIHAPKPGDVVKIASVYGSPWYRRCW